MSHEEEQNHPPMLALLDEPRSIPEGPSGLSDGSWMGENEEVIPCVTTLQSSSHTTMSAPHCAATQEPLRVIQYQPSAAKAQRRRRRAEHAVSARLPCRLYCP
jgi:hypothetical protein